MWKCSNCRHLEVAPERSKHCPVCGANQEKLLPHQVSGINGTKTLENLKQENLEAAFERENLASQTYPQLIREANEGGNSAVAAVFSFSRDVERGHAKLYRKALDHMM